MAFIFFLFVFVVVVVVVVKIKLTVFCSGTSFLYVRVISSGYYMCFLFNKAIFFCILPAEYKRTDVLDFPVWLLRYAHQTQSIVIQIEWSTGIIMCNTQHDQTLSADRFAFKNLNFISIQMFWADYEHYILRTEFTLRLVHFERI